MIDANWNSVQTVLSSVADFFTIDGEHAGSGKLPNMVTMQKYFHIISQKFTVTVYALTSYIL